MGETVKERLDTKLAEVELARASAELKMINVLTERVDTWREIPTSGYELTGNQPLFGSTYPPVPRIYTSVSDRADGRFLPFYECEHDLRRMRARARGLAAFTSTAISAMESLKNYVIGSGVVVEVRPKADGREGVVKAAQKVLDETYERGDVCGNLDAEIHNTGREDGDAFIVLYPNEKDKTIDLELNDAETCREPDNPRPLENWLGIGHKLNAWWYGVHTQYSDRKKRMDCRPLGYHFVYDEEGDQWDYISATRVEHFKHNVPHGAPRGISDYVPVDGDLSRQEKLKVNTGEGAAIQAAIAFIRQHAPGATKDQVTSMLSDNSVMEFNRATNGGTSTVNVERFAPGTVKDIPHGMQYIAGPMGQIRSPIFIEVASYILRSIGMRWKFPEYMISGDASNANFASTLVAESPFVKARESDQGFYIRGFRSLSWKVLLAAYRLGRFGGMSWQDVANSIEISVELPEVASRDKLANAQTNKILHDAKVLSLRTWSSQSELDFEEEQANIATEPKPQMMLPGQMGQQPQQQQPEQPQQQQPAQRAQQQPQQGVQEELAAELRENWQKIEGKRFLLVEDK